MAESAWSPSPGRDAGAQLTASLSGCWHDAQRGIRVDSPSDLVLQNLNEIRDVKSAGVGPYSDVHGIMPGTWRGMTGKRAGAAVAGFVGRPDQPSQCSSRHGSPCRREGLSKSESCRCRHVRYISHDAATQALIYCLPGCIDLAFGGSSAQTNLHPSRYSAESVTTVTPVWGLRRGCGLKAGATVSRVTLSLSAHQKYQIQPEWQNF